MPGILNIGVLGLGVMGRRMIERLAGHKRLRVCVAHDSCSEAMAALSAAAPQIRCLPSAEAVLATPGLHGVYIATPPQSHLQYSELALDAGLAVLCEKPLSTDLTAAAQLSRRIAAQRLRAAVNFSLAASPSLAALQLAFGAASHLPLGSLQRVELRLRFAQWPRPWQAQAGAWLSQRIEGGFSREVISHFIFVIQRVLGSAVVLQSQVDYPADGLGAESRLCAQLQAAGIPISIDAAVGGDEADAHQMRWLASGGAIELHDWYGVRQQRLPQALEALGSLDSLRQRALDEQTEQWVAMLCGQSHSLPGFAEALAVQQTIETLLQPDAGGAENERVKQADRPDSVQDLTLAGQSL